jgi:phospholipase C
MRRTTVPRNLLALGTATLLAACSYGRTLPPAMPGNQAAPQDEMLAKIAGSKISHVVILVQENRTFDNLFHGYPGADYANTGLTHDGKSVRLRSGPLEEYYDPGHTHGNFETEYDGGKNDGFDEVQTSPPSFKLAPYQYVNRGEVRPYFAIAHEFTLADHMFASQNGPSFPGHEYLIAGQASGAYDDPSNYTPWGCDAFPSTTVPVYRNGKYSKVFPCFNYQTLGDELDAAKLAWRYYTTPLSKLGIELLPDPYDAIRHIRFGRDWNHDDIAQPTRIIRDIKAGRLAAVSWVNSPALASDHPQLNDGHGPSWIAYVVNAVGSSQYYENTAIFVTWDDWGGWYDHVVPQEYGVLGHGFRVPLLVASAWSKHGYISKQPHEFGSILKFVEELYGLPSLRTRDEHSDDLADCFDFAQKPPKFKPIKLTTKPFDLRKLDADTRPNDNY